MPIYEYKCQGCGVRFERLVRSINGAEQIVCPGCGSESVERQLSVFAKVEASRGSSDFRTSVPTCTTGLCGL